MSEGRGGRPGAQPGSPQAIDDELARLRAEIERIDRALVELIASRVRVARRVGEVKRANDLPVMDPAREAAVVRRAGELAREAGLDEEATRELFWKLIALARDEQARDR